MREVRILSWCDLCPPEARTPSEAVWTVLMSEGESLTGQARSLDLCAEHLEELQTLAALLTARGAPVDASVRSTARRERAPVDCPVCGFVSAHRGALAAHLRREHDARLSEFQELALSGDRRTTPVACPECGRTTRGAQGLSAHRRAAHGVLGADARALSGDRRTTPVACPECGRTTGGAQGLSAHRRAAHGVLGAKARALAGQQELGA